MFDRIPSTNTNPTRQGACFVNRVNMRSRLRVTLLFFVLTTIGCGSPTAPKPNPSSSVTHKVTATNYPLAFFAEQILGDVAKVETILPKEEQDIEKWRPSAQQIKNMQHSDLVIVNGSTAPFEKWLTYVTLPESKLCQTANDGLLLSDMIAVKDVRIVHSHGPEGEHSHPTLVAYSWLAPEIATKQADLLCKRLQQTYPTSARQLESNRDALVVRLDELIREVDTLKAAVSPPTVITSTPDLKYLTRTLGWTDLHLTWSNTTGPIDAEKQLVNKLSGITPKPKHLIWTSSPPKPLKSIAEAAKLTSVVIDPMRQPPAKGDYFSTMRENLQRLEAVTQ